MHERLFTEIEGSYEELATLVRQIAPTRAAHPNLLGTWSAKEILAHLIGWEEEAVMVLCAMRDGTPLPQPIADEHAFNARSVERRQEKSWEELHLEWRETHHALMAVVSSMPAAQQDDARVVNWLQGSTINHYRLHQSDFAKAAEPPPNDTP